MAKDIVKEFEAESLSGKCGAVKDKMVRGREGKDKAAQGKAAEDETANDEMRKNVTRKMIPELSSLLQDVEKAYGRKIRTTTDFEALSVVIEREIHELLSASTLKRLWGYVSGTRIPRPSTLDILCKFIGKRDFPTYCKALREDKTVSSRFFSSKTVAAESLPIGAGLLLGWAPDRLVKLEYLGNCEFVVRESANSKLGPGDRFSAGSFMLGFPLYIPALHQASDPAASVSYVAGAVSGLNRLDIL